MIEIDPQKLDLSSILVACFLTLMWLRNPGNGTYLFSALLLYAISATYGQFHTGENAEAYDLTIVAIYLCIFIAIAFSKTITVLLDGEGWLAGFVFLIDLLVVSLTSSIAATYVSANGIVPIAFVCLPMLLVAMYLSLKSQSSSFKQANTILCMTPIFVVTLVLKSAEDQAFVHDAATQKLMHFTWHFLTATSVTLALWFAISNNDKS